MRKSWAIAGTALLMALAGTIAAPSASAVSGTVPGCALGVFVVPNGAPVRIDTSGCTTPSPQSIGSGSDVVIGPDYIDVTLGPDSAFQRFWTYPASVQTDVMIYSCSAPIGDLLRDPGLQGAYWDGLFAAAVDHCDWAVPSAPTADGATPPSWFQAYGRHAGEACEAGWTAGWAEWPNDGRGGPVCNRETYWDINGGTWSTR